jgi:hypothetical protein
MSQSTEPAVVVQKAYDWALWIIPKVEKFPKSYRFSIGQSLVAASGPLGAAVREGNHIRAGSLGL